VSFFPADSESSAPAIAICEQCPVSSECLDYAIRHRIQHGVWGGVDESGLKRMIRQRPSSRRTPPAA
jgi:WhiB family redox-sensing transcriptional regulator